MLVRPQLAYGSQFWSSCYRSDIIKVEIVLQIKKTELAGSFFPCNVESGGITL